MSIQRSHASRKIGKSIGKSVGQSRRQSIGLSIAGFDPSSGAGVTADLKVFEAHGIYGMAAITALTVQSTLGVRRSAAVDHALLGETLDCLRDDVCFAGIKIGMLATEQNVSVVASWLAHLESGQGAGSESGAAYEPKRVVLDPVLKSSSGAALANDACVEAIRAELLVRIGWITPNWMELAALTNLTVSSPEDIPAATLRLQEKAQSAGNFSLNVVATGGDQAGHLRNSEPDGLVDGPGDDLTETRAENLARDGTEARAEAQPGVRAGSQERSDDFLLTAAGEQFWLRGQRIGTTSTHGTGCAFSTALVCALIAGKGPYAACVAAKAYVTRALRAAYPIGRGRGPLNPFV